MDSLFLLSLKPVMMKPEKMDFSESVRVKETGRVFGDVELEADENTPYDVLASPEAMLLDVFVAPAFCLVEKSRTMVWDGCGPRDE
mmetsp:Transcript_9066/g.33435  ORF Transcript_9066/g.33435 Transcript_9066/m.33435 type:complete len:86 (+) Transcript_9066:877-1134(+)